MHTIVSGCSQVPIHSCNTPVSAYCCLCPPWVPFTVMYKQRGGCVSAVSITYSFRVLSWTELEGEGCSTCGLTAPQGAAAAVVLPAAGQVATAAAVQPEIDPIVTYGGIKYMTCQCRGWQRLSSAAKASHLLGWAQPGLASELHQPAAAHTSKPDEQRNENPVKLIQAVLD